MSKKVELDPDLRDWEYDGYGVKRMKKDFSLYTNKSDLEILAEILFESADMLEKVIDAKEPLKDLLKAQVNTYKKIANILLIMEQKRKEI